MIRIAITQAAFDAIAETMRRDALRLVSRAIMLLTGRELTCPPMK
jgi:hypothetical protein